MPNLSASGVASWRSKLPEDLLGAVGNDPASDEAFAASIGARLEAGGVEGAIQALEENADAFIGLGRTRRVRFLAWMAKATYPDSALIFRRIAERAAQEGGSGEGGGIAKVAPYFLADIEALVGALGPRVAQKMVNGTSIAAISKASFEVQSEAEFRQAV
jgi:hypothetical protein